MKTARRDEGEPQNPPPAETGTASLQEAEATLAQGPQMAASAARLFLLAANRFRQENKPTEASTCEDRARQALINGAVFQFQQGNWRDAAQQFWAVARWYLVRQSQIDANHLPEYRTHLIATYRLALSIVARDPDANLLTEAWHRELQLYQDSFKESPSREAIARAAEREVAIQERDLAILEAEYRIRRGDFSGAVAVLASPREPQEYGIAPFFPVDFPPGLRHDPYPERAMRAIGAAYNGLVLQTPDLADRARILEGAVQAYRIMGYPENSPGWTAITRWPLIITAWQSARYYERSGLQDNALRLYDTSEALLQIPDRVRAAPLPADSLSLRLAWQARVYRAQVALQAPNAQKKYTSWETAHQAHLTHIETEITRLERLEETSQTIESTTGVSTFSLLIALHETIFWNTQSHQLDSTTPSVWQTAITYEFLESCRTLLDIVNPERPTNRLEMAAMLLEHVGKPLAIARDGQDVGQISISGEIRASAWEILSNLYSRDLIELMNTGQYGRVWRYYDLLAASLEREATQTLASALGRLCEGRLRDAAQKPQQTFELATLGATFYRRAGSPRDARRLDIAAEEAGQNLVQSRPAVPNSTAPPPFPPGAPHFILRARIAELLTRINTAESRTAQDLIRGNFPSSQGEATLAALMMLPLRLFWQLAHQTDTPRETSAARLIVALSFMEYTLSEHIPRDWQNDMALIRGIQRLRETDRSQVPALRLLRPGDPDSRERDPQKEPRSQLLLFPDPPREK